MATRRNAIIATAAAAALVVLAYAFADIPLARALHGFQEHGAFTVVATISRIGESHWILVPAFLMFVYWRGAQPERARHSLRVFVAVGLTGIAVLGAKALAGRARPHLLFQEGEFGFRLLELSPAFQSFPSGHATTLFAAATIGAILWPRGRALLFVGVMLLAATRLLIARHYLSDVIAGAWFGVAGALLVDRYVPTTLRQSYRAQDARADV